MARPRYKLDPLKQADPLAACLKHEPAGWRRERLQAVQLGLQGELSLQEIAQATGRSRSTIQEWFDAFRQGGVELLLQDKRNDNPGCPGKLTVAAKEQLQEGLKKGRWRSAPQMQSWLKLTHGLKLAQSSLYHYLGKAGARAAGSAPSAHQKRSRRRS